ncbi:hypothetical protein BDP27DRAFT_1335048 [Rhodocollybia butyracea]|uniref:ubiquitinyl hydrolase 1 n=1 Tax=Rhodocollybia butyracea TaxID=206335 RepID=A0A9P5U231_9AGAR|nr:hypothetical protein BDP27DRAFT_1335048 [Rhodocollybia butyracea]
MAKSKALTPQEIYRAKKQQEEEERLAFLPPGLINHGNTCFMNSVLQGLIATRLLSQLVHFDPIPPQVQAHSSTLLASHRSPQLTNGHDLGGIYEKKWVNTMPIGDVFIGVTWRAWEAQRLRKRESMSPRPLLNALGKKYDQYLDFAQQDAHEFLRILLDAMRMEVIKKRQPPPPAASSKRKVRRKSTITPANSNQLASLSDMLFGGQLTSILVCQKCKNVSQTYEDFNDLSLSIKAEDYEKERKRDRFKKLARKMGMAIQAPIPSHPSPATQTVSAPTLAIVVPPEANTPGIRASSVPPTPNTNGIAEHEPRRRSLDGLINGNADTPASDDDDAVSIEKPLPLPPGLGPSSPDEKRIEFAEAPKRSDKAKDKDNWARIGRRISMTVGIGKLPKEKGKDKERKSRSRSRVSADLNGGLNGDQSAPNSTVESLQQPEIRLFRPSMSPERPQSTPPIFLKRAMSSQNQVLPQKPKSRPQSLSPSPSHTAIPDADSAPKVPYIQRSKSPKPPKPSKAEEDYLRAILADVQTASSVSGPNPFDFFASWHHGDDSNGATTPSILPSTLTASVSFGQLPLAGIEEFLDGENMVGCRRCWKLANGWKEEKQEQEDDGDDSEDDDEDDELNNSQSEDPGHLRRTSSAPASPTLPSSFSSPTLGLEAISAISSPPDVSGQHPSSTDLVETSGSLPIPSIRTAQMETGRQNPSLHTPSPKDEEESSAEQSSLTTDYISDGAESDSTTSISTATSAAASTTDPSTPSARSFPVYGTIKPQRTSSAGTPSVSVPPRPPPKKPKGPKPVIMRPAYKRYLIATPPPILVIHMKRFQQINKNPIMSFSSGFKKLEDYVAFPEYLDLTPFLAPKKEDFGLRKNGPAEGSDMNGKRKSKGVKERCVYRLYAVVVHIGNMVSFLTVSLYLIVLIYPLHSSEVITYPTPLFLVRQWAYISDTIVRLTTLEEVLKAKAYICMYERV